MNNDHLFAFLKSEKKRKMTASVIARALIAFALNQIPMLCWCTAISGIHAYGLLVKPGLNWCLNLGAIIL